MEVNRGVLAGVEEVLEAFNNVESGNEEVRVVVLSVLGLDRSNIILKLESKLEADKGGLLINSRKELNFLLDLALIVDLVKVDDGVLSVRDKSKVFLVAEVVANVRDGVHE